MISRRTYKVILLSFTTAVFSVGLVGCKKKCSSCTITEWDGFCGTEGQLGAPVTVQYNTDLTFNAPILIGDTGADATAVSIGPDTLAQAAILYTTPLTVTCYSDALCDPPLGSGDVEDVFISGSLNTFSQLTSTTWGDAVRIVCGSGTAFGTFSYSTGVLQAVLSNYTSLFASTLPPDAIGGCFLSPPVPASLPTCIAAVP